MHIEDIFEDLEAQFAAAGEVVTRDSYTQNARAIEVAAGRLVPRELIAPILGKDFVAGLDAVSPIWHIFPMRNIHRMVFHSETENDLPKLRNFNIGLVNFLNSVPTPCSIRWRVSGADDFVRTGQLHTVTRSLLFIYVNDARRPIALPIQALEQLSIESVDNLNGDF